PAWPGRLAPDRGRGEVAMSAFVTVRAEGSGRELGTAHATATLHLREQVAQWVRRAVTLNPPTLPVVARRLGEVEAVLERHSPQTLEQIAGMGDVYDLGS